MLMDERVFSVLFNNISAVVEALEPFTPATADIHRMWYGPRGYFLLSPEGLVRRRDLIRQALRYGDWNEKFSAEYLAGRLRDIIEIHAISGADQARADFDAAIALEPKLGEGWVNRGALSISERRYQEGMDDINHGLQLGVKEPEKAYFNRAVAYEGLDDEKAAYLDYQQALSLKPDWALPQRELLRFTVTRR